MQGAAVEDSLVAEESKSALVQRLEGLDEDEQHAVLLDLVRSHIGSVLGGRCPETVDPDWAFQELGFDSLTAVELRNRLKAATGLALPATILFDYPNSAALVDHMHGELVGDAVAPVVARKDLADMDLDDLVNAVMNDDDG